MKEITARKLVESFLDIMKAAPQCGHVHGALDRDTLDYCFEAIIREFEINDYVDDEIEIAGLRDMTGSLEGDIEDNREEIKDLKSEVELLLRRIARYEEAHGELPDE